MAQTTAAFSHTQKMIQLRKKCRYSEIFQSVFSHIWTEYGNLLHKSPSSVQMP